MATTVMSKPTKRQKTKTQSRKKSVPEVLVYEMAHGKPIYYKGYQEVMQGKKQLEEIMGSSFLQSLVISRLVRFLLTCLPEVYEVLTNELGLQFSKKHWRAADIAIYHKEQLRNIPLQNKYLEIPPKIVFEIDTKADIEQFTTPLDYYYTKTDELLAFGVEKVIWIFTEAQKIMLAESGKDWIITNWDQDIQVIDDIHVNVSQIIV
jgi:hypothetical protein